MAKTMTRMQPPLGSTCTYVMRSHMRKGATRQANGAQGFDGGPAYSIRPTPKTRKAAGQAGQSH